MMANVSEKYNAFNIFQPLHIYVQQKILYRNIFSCQIIYEAIFDFCSNIINWISFKFRILLYQYFLLTYHYYMLG